MSQQGTSHPRSSFLVPTLCVGTDTATLCVAFPRDAGLALVARMVPWGRTANFAAVNR